MSLLCYKYLCLNYNACLLSDIVVFNQIITQFLKKLNIYSEYICLICSLFTQKKEGLLPS